MGARPAVETRARLADTGWYAGHIRALIARRAEHSDRAVLGHLNGWIEGNLAPNHQRSIEAQLQEVDRVLHRSGQ